VLFSFVYIASHPRLVFTFPSLRPVAPTHYSRKPFTVNVFADPYPLTPVTSTFYKNGGRGPLFLTSLPHYPFTSSSLSPFPATFVDRHAKCYKQKTYASAKPFRCNIYKKRGGGGLPQAHPTQFPDSAFIRSVTCPEGVHRTYYWSRQPVSPSYFQATVPSFPSTLFCVGGCDG